MSAELDRAIADVKCELGVETVQAHVIADRLPEHLRQEFWRGAVERYLLQSYPDGPCPDCGSPSPAGEACG